MIMILASTAEQGPKLWTNEVSFAIGVEMEIR